MKIAVTALVGLVLLGGCSHASLDATQTSTHITCKPGQDCERKWSRAENWVETTSSWKILYENGNAIKTLGPSKYSASAAISITKTENVDQSYDINLEAMCDFKFECIPSSSELQASFAKAVLDPPT
jgi:hypothetical protein